MSDKMLMEDWRKFLVEVGEGIPKEDRIDWTQRRPTAVDPNDPGFKAAAADAWEKIKAAPKDMFRSLKKEILPDISNKEDESDRLIEAIGFKEPWRRYFSWVDWVRAGKKSSKGLPLASGDGGPPVLGWNPEEHTQPSHPDILGEMANDPDWQRVMALLVISRASNRNEDWWQKADVLGEVLGHGSSTASQIIGLSGGLVLGLAPAAVAVAAGATAATIATLGVLVPVVGAIVGVAFIINKINKDKDFELVSDALEEQGFYADQSRKGKKIIDKSVPKVRKTFEAFYTAEHEVLKQLAASPTSLPNVSAIDLFQNALMGTEEETKTELGAQTLRDEKPVPTGQDAVYENAYNNWRNFLLAEEKL